MNGQSVEQDPMEESGAKLVFGTHYYDGKPYQRWAVAYEDHGKWWGFDSGDVIKDVTRVLAFAELLERRLKPLVWDCENKRWDAVARTAFADYAGSACKLQYMVAQRGDRFMYWIGSSPKCHECDSIEHGKQLCQADYERRVSELFESAAAESGEA